MSDRTVRLTWRRSTHLVRLAPHHRALVASETNGPTDPAHLAMQLERWLRAGACGVLFSDCEAREVGYALIEPMAPTGTFIRHFLVDASARRQGIGRAMLDLLRDEVEPATTRWHLDVLGSNAEARAFWHACGFREASVRMTLTSPPNADRRNAGD